MDRLADINTVWNHLSKMTDSGSQEPESCCLDDYTCFSHGCVFTDAEWPSGLDSVGDNAGTQCRWVLIIRAASLYSGVWYRCKGRHICALSEGLRRMGASFHIIRDGLLVPVKIHSL